MRAFRLPVALAFFASLILAGCAGVRSETTRPPEAPPAADSGERKGAGAESEKHSDAVDVTDSVSPASVAVAHGSDTTSPAGLVAQLNDATRELATLRASNAKLKAANAQRGPERTVVREPEPADAKIAASVQSYAKFKQELAGFFAEVEKLRSENASLNTKLKDIDERAREAQAAIVKLEVELSSEKTGRAAAEQTTAKLREQLRAVATAVAAAGLTLEPATSGGEPTARLETSPARLRAAVARLHTVKDSETLETIAEHYYGNAAKWRLILDANRGRLPLDGALPPGLELEIPAK